jgi:DedD protein
MEPRLKHRLVGASVLVALGVIFLPELLQPQAERPDSPVDMTIPPAPEIRTELVLPPAADSAPRAADDRAPRVGLPAEEGRDPAIAVPRGAPGSMQVAPDLVAWVVQLGSFAEAENAEKLQTQLRDAGFRAYTEPVRNQGLILHRVRVGPEPGQAEAEQLLGEIESRLGIRGMVRRHPSES